MDRRKMKLALPAVIAALAAGAFLAACGRGGTEDMKGTADKPPEAAQPAPPGDAGKAGGGEDKFGC